MRQLLRRPRREAEMALSGIQTGLTCAGPCTKSELNLTNEPHVQVGIVGQYDVLIGPKSSLDGAGPLEFEITSSSEDYLDLSSLALKLKIKISNADGSDLVSYTGNNPKPTDNRQNQFSVVPANLMLHSLFRQVDFTMNDTLVTSSGDTYPYRAFLTTLLSYGREAKKTFLQHMEFYYPDDPYEYDLETNEAIVYKNERSGNSKIFDLRGRLHIDMCMQERPT